MNSRRLKLGLAIASVLALAAGAAERLATDRCSEAWERAGERSRGYLTDRAASPYLAMMFASHYTPPAGLRISSQDFMAACRAGAIWQYEPQPERRITIEDFTAGCRASAAPQTVQASTN